jgi:hypothetical protein
MDLSEPHTPARPPHTVIPIPLSLLLHPLASEWPYAMWVMRAQASHGGVQLPMQSDGYHLYFECTRTVLRSALTDAKTELDARDFAAEIYRANLGASTSC